MLRVRLPPATYMSEKTEYTICTTCGFMKWCTCKRDVNRNIYTCKACARNDLTPQQKRGKP